MDMKTVNVPFCFEISDYRAAWFLYSKVNEQDEIINPTEFDSHIIIRDISEQEAENKLETLKDVELYSGKDKCKFLHYEYVFKHYEPGEIFL